MMLQPFFKFRVHRADGRGQGPKENLRERWLKTGTVAKNENDGEAMRSLT